MIKNRISIITSNQCNNNCFFCLDTEKRKFLKPMSLDKAQVLFKKGIEKEGGILFTMGEPTINENLLPFITMARKIGYKDICLVTNGRRLCYLDYTEQLLKAGLTEISVSFHGSNRMIHESLTRTPGSFEQTLKSIYNLSFFKKYYKFGFYINFTLNKINAGNLYGFLKMCASLKIDGIIINVVIPQGRGLKFFEALVINYTSLAKSFKSAINKLQGNFELQKITAFLGSNNPNINILGLPACLLVSYEKYIGKFEKILMDKPSLNKRSRIEIKEISRSKRIKREECKECKYYQSCEGIWKEYIKRRGWSEFVPVH